MRLACLVLVLTLSPLTRAQAEAPAADTCSAPEFHTLDFWIGSWNVVTIEGEPAGANRIERALADCLLLEYWREPASDDGRAHQGFGVHRYDRSIGRWRQAWTMDTGLTYDMVGHLEDQRVVYERTGPSGSVVGRTTITPLPDGRVEQKGERWDQKSQGWQTTFHLIYTRD